MFNAYDFVSVTGAKIATLTGIDSLDGGEGKEYINVKSDNGITAALLQLLKISKTINLESGAAIKFKTLADFDTTTFTGAETLNVTKQLLHI